MKHYISSRAVCRHYLHESKQTIYCDGITCGSVCHLAFANSLDKKKYREEHCYNARGCEQCTLGHAIKESEEQDDTDNNR